jgi:hypothetical protein
MSNNIIKKKFYSVDIANSNHNKLFEKKKSMKSHISVKKTQSNQVEAENFYKPISKYLNF